MWRVLMVALGVGSSVGLFSAKVSAQMPSAMICQFEKIADVAVDEKGVVMAETDKSEGDLVVTKLDTDTPTFTGNLGTLELTVIQRRKEAIWLAAAPPDNPIQHAPIEIFTIFSSGVLMHAKTELLGADKPFGFVEIGKCRPVK